MLQVLTTYKNYPLRGTVTYNDEVGYKIFLEYELAAFQNKNIIVRSLNILEFLQTEETKAVLEEDYEAAEVMKQLQERIKENLNDY